LVRGNLLAEEPERVLPEGSTRPGFFRSRKPWLAMGNSRQRFNSGPLGAVYISTLPATPAFAVLTSAVGPRGRR